MASASSAACAVIHGEQEGIDALHLAVECKYTAVQAVTMLHKIYVMLKQQYPSQPSEWERWGEVVVKLEQPQAVADHFFSLGNAHLQLATDAARFQDVETGKRMLEKASRAFGRGRRELIALKETQQWSEEDETLLCNIVRWIAHTAALLGQEQRCAHCSMPIHPLPSLSLRHLCS